MTALTDGEGRRRDHRDLPDFPRTEGELEQWIKDGIEESSTLDYKRAASLGRDTEAEIAKDVSAMANSAGGVLIYGVAEHPRDSPKKHLPDKIDPVDGSAFSKEWFEHKISSGIQPKIPDVLIHPIRLTTPANGVVYVVVVPRGNTAHQAVQRRKYYRRYNFESVAMEDYEIRDIMHRVTHPEVKLEFELSTGPAGNAFGQPSPREYRWLHIKAANFGKKLAQHVFASVYLHTDSMANAVGYRYFEDTGGVFAIIPIDISIVPSHGSLEPTMRNSAPLLPGMDRHVKTVQLKETTAPLPTDNLLYELHADEAPVFRDQVKFVNIPLRPKTGIPMEFVSSPLRRFIR